MLEEILLKYKKKVEAMRRTLPDSEELECPECNQNFYDEYNWEEDFDPGSQSHQHCRYNIDNEDFVLLTIK